MRTKLLARTKLSYIAFSLCLVAGLVICMLMVGCSSSTSDNRAVLQELENRSVDDSQKLISQRADEKKIGIIREYGMDGFLEPDPSCQVFENCIVIGDSVTYMGFLAGYLNEASVSAYYSVSLKTCDEYVQAAIDLHPDRIIFNFGTNDMVLFGNVAEDYAAMYLERCNWVKSQLPNCKVYICSTLQPSQQAMADNDGMRCANEFNDAVKAMCSQNGITYVDTADLAVTYEHLHSEDGIHYQNEFYGYWYARVAQEIFL